MMVLTSVAVFDCSAVITGAQQREGWEAVTSQLVDEKVAIFFHRQNATEFWYQTHRREALAAFMRANPHRMQPNGQTDLTGLDLLDPTIFDAQRGKRIADKALALLEASQVQIVGDETYPDLWKRAAELKSQYRRISLADCFGVALANALNAPFWTSDRHELTALQDAGIAKIHFIR